LGFAEIVVCLLCFTRPRLGKAKTPLPQLPSLSYHGQVAFVLVAVRLAAKWPGCVGSAVGNPGKKGAERG
jgi:hypothetical protein